MNSFKSVGYYADSMMIEGFNYRFFWSLNSGLLSAIELWDGIKWNQVLEPGFNAGFMFDLVLREFKVSESTDSIIRIKAEYSYNEWILHCEYEIFGRGYIICTFYIQAAENRVNAGDFKVGLPLSNDKVFSNNFVIKNGAESGPIISDRAISVDFSTDARPVTNSIDFILESVRTGFKGDVCRKVEEDHSSYKFIGWQLSSGGCFKKGYVYRNRWCISVSGLQNNANKVRGQRIYHWYGLYPYYPSDEIIDEMKEYGCSILILHMPSFKYISGCEPVDESELIRTVNKAHDLEIKVLFYCQPYLISINSPEHAQYDNCLNDDLLRWDSMKSTQIVFYKENTDYDCDALCLRCDSAYSYIRDSVLGCYKKYGFNGLYIDWAWPEQAICNDISHGHEAGLFNFYDYIRLIREWREAIGPDAIMIGHGGGYLAASDFVEGFDACLTGEAQKDLEPAAIGQQFGLATTLWAMHRKKEQVFRSRAAIASIIREGITPHAGIGIMGTSVLASVDPAHNIPLLALWQMWRAFPVNRAVFYSYLTEQVVTLDNEEVKYSLYITPEKYILLILCNAGGKYLERMPAVGVNIRLDLKKLCLPGEMNCWRMKGNTYETFRLSRVDNVIDGGLNVPELGLYEFIGFVLSCNEPPEELLKLEKHLEGRYERLLKINKVKLDRLKEFDKLIDDFAGLPNAGNMINYAEFMKGRTAE